MAQPQTYRGWDIRQDNPPVPMPSSGWFATSPDYDVDGDSEGFWVCSGVQLEAGSYDELIAEIDAHIAEQGA